MDTPAFPTDAGGLATLGMTLRDYFAAKAMQAYIADEPAQGEDVIAEWAYRNADAMLKEREKK